METSRAPTRSDTASRRCPRGSARACPAIRARARELALKEAYRLVTVREGDRVMSLPAIQAVMRSQFALAVKGNGPAQRAMIAAIHAMEQELSAEAAAREKEAAEHGPIDYIDGARRISLLLRLAYKQKGEPMPDNVQDAAAGLLEDDKAKTGG
jgi:hypothetical protein